MNKRAAFVLGIALTLFICGVGQYFIGKESDKLNESIFMAGYSVELATLVAVQNEPDILKKEELLLSELCETVFLLIGKIENDNFNREYFEVVVNKTVGEYRSLLAEIESHNCE